MDLQIITQINFQNNTQRSLLEKKRMSKYNLVNYSTLDFIWQFLKNIMLPSYPLKKMSDFYAIPHCIISEMELLEQQVVMMYSRT